MWRNGNPLNSVGGNENWYSHCGKHYDHVSKKLKTELSYDPEIPLLGIYPEKSMTWKDLGTQVSTEALYNSQDLEAT